MDSVVQDRRAWQDVVAEKRRLQAEALAGSAFSDNIPGINHDGDLIIQGVEPVEASELVARLARGELSCVSHVRSYINKLVRVV